MSDGFRCLVCHAREAQPVWLGCPDYYLGKPFVTDYRRCLSCRLLQQDPVPRDVAAFYEGYPVHVPKSPFYDALRWLVMSRLYFDTKDLPAGARLLDYGCGDGSYLETRRGSGLVLAGYEADAAQARRLTERLALPVHSDLAGLLGEAEGTQDAVTMHFVVEHLTDLDLGFEAARRLLKPEGCFYFVVPHEDSLEARLFGRRWHNLDPPRHVSFPARAHVAELAARHGFRLERDAPAAFPNGFAASVPVVLTGRFRFLLFALALPLGLVFSRLCPTGVRAYWLRRLP